MHSQMQKAEDYAKDLAKYYIAASRHLQSEQNAILRRFALTHHMTVKEAEELISSLKEPDIKELIKALKKDPKNAELVREFEAHSARARIMRLNSLQSQVTYTTGQIQVLLNKKAQKLFVNLARSAYYNTMFDAMQRAGYGFNVKMLDPKRIKRVMDRSWTGAGFSKRLWSNTKALEDAVKREIMVNLLTGRPLIKASQAINEEFGKGYNNARRLIRTESAYITNQMTLEGYKDLEADKYIYVAILDLKTSEVCRGLDKKRFLVKSAKVGVNYPPMHPWCRSTTIPWMPDSLLKNMKQRALDPRTGKHVLVPGDMTYEEWYKQFVQGQPAGDPTTQQRNFTRDQYDRYKERLGDDFDYSYDEFLKAKGDPQIWADLQQKYKDARQYEDYKALMGDKIPDSLDMFRDLKYNNPDRWQYIQDLRTYLKKYPNSDSRYFDAKQALKVLGIRKGELLPAMPKKALLEPSPNSNDPQHMAQRMSERGISAEEAQSYIDNARAMFSQWKGERELFVGDEGMSVIEKYEDNWHFVTVWSKAEYNEESKSILEALNDVGL